MKKYISYIIIALLIGCTKEEITPRVYPRVDTQEAVDISSTGVTFKGEITYSNVEIVDHGFVWSDASGPVLTNGNKVSLGSKTGAGPFETRVDRSLESGKKYFIRAYAVGNDFTVYGVSKEFVSLGGKAPVMKDFYPTSGTWSDTVVVVGENFSDEIRTNSVKFSDYNAPILRANKDTLIVIVPSALTMDLSTIKVSVAGNSSSIEKQYKLQGPIIESVTPGIGLPGAKVIIEGNYLLSSATKVYFDDSEASVLNWSGKKIECVVPNRPNGEVTLKVRTGSGTMFATAPFKIQPEHLPELYQVQPAVAKIGETIKLTGNHFATEPDINSVKFGNTSAYVISQSKTEIEVMVPETETRLSTITVTCYGSSVSIDGFALMSPVITDFSPHRGMGSEALTITGSDFIWTHLKVFLGDQQLQIQSVEETQINAFLPRTFKEHESTLKVTYYDQEFILNTKFKTPWIMIDPFPETGLTSSHVLVYNNAAYLALAGNGTNNQVWKFSNETWTRMNDFPGIPQGSSLGNTFSFVAGGKGYIGGGDIDGMQQSKDLWEYDFDADTWTKQSEIPIEDHTRTGFGMGTEGFVFETDFTNDPTLWRYNAATDTWSIKTVAPNGVSGIARSFVIGSSIYLVDSWGGQTFWKYAPASNQWTSLSAPEIFKYAFSIGSVGYAGNYYSLFKFNSVTNNWLQDLGPYLDDDNVVSFSINGKGYLFRRSTGTFDKFAYEYDPNY